MSIIDDSNAALTGEIFALESCLTDYDRKVRRYRQTLSEADRDRVNRSLRRVCVKFYNVSEITQELYDQHTQIASDGETLNEILQQYNEVTTILERAQSRVASTEDVWPGAGAELNNYLVGYRETISSLTASINQIPAGQHYMLPATGVPAQQNFAEPYYAQGQTAYYTQSGTQYGSAAQSAHGYVIGEVPEDTESNQQQPHEDQHQQQQ